MDVPNVATQRATMKSVRSKPSSQHYIIIERIDHDTFYDIAFVRLGFIEEEGIIIKLPIPHTINTEWVDLYITEALDKIVNYIKEK